jgi:hypothetical protein
VNPKDPRDLLDRIGVLRNRCDLDVLVFFARHPNSLLASESLAAFQGYSLQEIVDSMDVLVTAGLLQRTHTPAHAARLFVFVHGGPNDEWLPALIDLASTRRGRLALREALAGRSPGIERPPGDRGPSIP